MLLLTVAPRDAQKWVAWSADGSSAVRRAEKEENYEQSRATATH